MWIPQKLYNSSLFNAHYCACLLIESAVKRKKKSTIDLDIRAFRRYLKEVDFHIHIKDTFYKARTVDYAPNSLGISIDGFPPLKPGTIVPFHINELNIHDEGRIIRTLASPDALRAGVARIGTLKGSFHLYGISDILLGIQKTLKTGVLDIRFDSINKKIYFKNGSMVYATSNHDKDRLADILLKKRRINKKQYEETLKMKQQTGEREGTILVRSGFIKAPELKPAVELQVKRIIGSLLILRYGEFEFIEESFKADDVITLKLSAANLIYRQVKRTADVQLVQDRLLDSIVHLSPTPLDLFQDITLPESDKEILSLVNGENRIKDIIRRFSCKRADPLKSIYALLEARIIKIKEVDERASGINHDKITEKKQKPSHHTIKKIEHMYSHYMSLGYYGVLGLQENATAREIKTAYYKRAKEYHPNLHSGLPKDTKKKLLEIFTFMTKAYVSLRESAEQKEGDKWFQQYHHKRQTPLSDATQSSIFENDVGKTDYDGDEFDQTTAASNSEIAVSKYKEGKKRFRFKKYEEAAQLFAMAIYFDRSIASYHYFYGYSLEMFGKLKEAVESLNRALDLQPNDPDILAELGHVYMKLGFPLRGKGYFKKALSFNPSLKRAQEGMESLSGT